MRTVTSSQAQENPERRNSKSMFQYPIVGTGRPKLHYVHSLRSGDNPGGKLLNIIEGEGDDKEEKVVGYIQKKPNKKCLTTSRLASVAYIAIYPGTKHSHISFVSQRTVQFHLKKSQGDFLRSLKTPQQAPIAEEWNRKEQEVHIPL